MDSDIVHLLRLLIVKINLVILTHEWTLKCILSWYLHL